MGMHFHLARCLGLSAALAVAPLALGQADEQAGIEQVVHNMQQAIALGNGQAYLQLIDLREGVFATEHRNFVRDWQSKPPTALTIRASNISVAGELAQADLLWAWRSGEASRSASFGVVFRKVGASWRYAGERWNEMSLNGVRVLWQGTQQDTARVLASELPALQAQATRALGLQTTPAPVLKLYADSEALSASVHLSMQPVGGWTEPGEAVKLARPSWPAARSTLLHELTHHAVFEHYGEGQSRIPWWLHEGVAQFVASDTWSAPQRQAYLQRSVNWQAREELPEFSRLAVFETTPDALWGFVYAQGYAFVRFAVESRGMQTLAAFMEQIARGQTLDAASLEAFGVSFARLDGQFRSWLLKR